jgi:peptidoglycan/xylan/chitin deacetylase (PgdA/CDA1 family)
VRRAIPRRARRLAGSAATLVAFTVPVYLFAGLSTSPSYSREPAPQVMLTPAQLARARAFPVMAGGVPVLTYHDISDDGGPRAVRPQLLAAHMAILRAAGFHAIGLRELLAHLERGAPLPPRPILITFDDGLHSAWATADPILEANGFRAVAFLIAGQLGRHRPYYMDAGEVRDLLGSGRWDVGAHTFLGHGDVAVDDRGGTGPFLTNRAWLPDAGRLETRHEFAARVARDLDRGTAALEALGAPRPEAFAYPFAVDDAPADDPALPGILRRAVDARYRVSFVDDAGARAAVRRGEGLSELPRIAVTSDVSPEGLLDRIEAAMPVPPRLRGLAPSRWVGERGRPVPVTAFRSGRLALRTGAGLWGAAYFSPDQAAAWRDYRVSLRVAGLGEGDSGANATVMLRASERPSDPRVAVTIAAGRVTLQRVDPGGSVPVASTVIEARPRHRLQVTVQGDMAAVAVDGRPALRHQIHWSASGGIGLGTWRARTASPHPVFSDLEVVRA